jgi:hypothetical protein
MHINSLRPNLDHLDRNLDHLDHLDANPTGGGYYVPPPWFAAVEPNFLELEKNRNGR